MILILRYCHAGRPAADVTRCLRYEPGVAQPLPEAIALWLYRRARISIGRLCPADIAVPVVAEAALMRRLFVS